MKKRKIYCGPKGAETSMYWLISMSRAKKPVELTGPLKQGRAGSTIGCGFSNLAMTQRTAFPHPVYLISVIGNSLVAIDKLNKAGQPIHGVLYAHSYGALVDANDFRKLKDDVEGPFLFAPPRERHGSSGISGKRRPPRTDGAIPRGCLLRAQKAGLIDPVAIKQMQAAG